MRALPAVVLLALLAPLAAVPAGGSEAAAAVDLDERLKAGEFRAYRLRLLEPATIELGGTYDHPGTGTTHPVLPLMTVLRTAAGWDMRVYTLADDTMFRQPAGYQVLVQTPVTTQAFGAPLVNYMAGGGAATYEVPAGEVVLLLASANSTDFANLHLRIHGAAEVLATQKGRTFYDRGLDHSAIALDAHAQGAAGLVAGRAWAYSGAALPLAVGGRLYAYVGERQGTAYLEAPDGERFFAGLADQAPGAWTAAFPPEAYLGPVCAARACPPGLDAREDPPFVLAADVSV